MRIGFFTDSYLPRADGIAVSVETFRVELEKLGHEVFIIAPAAGLRVKEPSKRIIRFPAFKGLFFDDYQTTLYFPPQALRRVDKAKLDVIHYHTPGQVGLLGAYYGKRHNLPVLTTYHTDLREYVLHYKNVLPGTIVLSLLAPLITGGKIEDYRTVLANIRPEPSIDNWNQKVVENGLSVIHNACDEIIAPSLKVKHMLEKWNSPTHITVLQTGVERIPTTKRDIASWRKRLSLADDTPVVLFVGRLGTEKNLDLLIEAFALLAKKNDRAQLVVVGGSGSLTEASSETYVAATRHLFGGERVKFTGWVPHDKLGALYGLGTVFAFPSLTETQGLVINEAARSGLPIVLVDGEVSDVAINGENGYTAKPTAKDLADKLGKILDSPDLQKQMSLRSQELAAQYGARQQAQKLLRLYEEVI